MALKDIKNLKDLQRERQKLKTEQQLAIQGIKTNARTEYNIAKSKIENTAGQIKQGFIATEETLNNFWSGWKLPALGSIGAILGIILTKWLFGEKEVEETDERRGAESDDQSNDSLANNSEEPATISEAKVARPTEDQQSNTSAPQQESRLEDRIKKAMAEFEAEKADAAPSPLFSILSALGPLLLKEVLKSGILKQFFQENPPPEAEAMQDFSNQIADELEALKADLR